MPDVNVYETFKELIQRLLSGDEEVAELAATDPEGLLAAYGITEASLDGVDFRQAVDECYHDYDLGDGSKQALDSYVAGGSAPDHYQVKTPPSNGDYQTSGDAVQHLQYVTYATHENNEHITREIVNKQFTVDNSDNRVFDIDNSAAFDIDGNVDGDISVTPTTAAGDGAIANTGDDNVFGTGEGDILNAARGGEVNAATGDGAVQGEHVGAANTGRLEGVQAGGDVDGAVNTGQNSGLLADGEVENPVLGDDNQTANLDISAGSGDGGNASGSGGDATGGGLNDSRNDLFEGAEQDNSTSAGDGTGGDATGGTGGSVGSVNLNFGSGDQANANVEGDVRNSAISGEGDADNALNADARRFASQEADATQEAGAEARPVEEAQEAELVEEAIAQEQLVEEQATEEFGGGALEAEVATETAELESQVAEPVSG